MASAKQLTAANVHNNALVQTLKAVMDAVVILRTTLQNGSTGSNRPATMADLSEISLETALIDIAGYR